MARKRKRKSNGVTDGDTEDYDAVEQQLLSEADDGYHEQTIQWHYDHPSQVPQNIKKYYSQRYSIFSKYDEGIWLTNDAWFGITPEPVAITIAKHLAEAAPSRKTVLIDLFGGAGGNAIAFALSGRWEQIFVIEKDPDTMKCAKHNAEIYGVSKKIFWIENDCFKVAAKRFASLGKKAVVFASPPWGGPGYTSDPVLDLSTMQPYSLDQLYTSFSKITKDMVLFLPRTSDLSQLARYAPEDRTLPIVHYCMAGASKALCAYFGDLVLRQPASAPGAPTQTSEDEEASSRTAILSLKEHAKQFYRNNLRRIGEHGFQGEGGKRRKKIRSRMHERWGDLSGTHSGKRTNLE